MQGCKNKKVVTRSKCFWYLGLFLFCVKLSEKNKIFPVGHQPSGPLDMCLVIPILSKWVLLCVLSVHSFPEPFWVKDFCDSDKLLLIKAVFNLISFEDFYVSISLPWMLGRCGMCCLFITQISKHNKVDAKPSNM
jgi:hypothetical protein